ncbi:MAG: DUF2953 domain-containing protein [Clostridia bacterium]|nr:DUF2953 domain-containing protein [Clostridia bacterium]
MKLYFYIFSGILLLIIIFLLFYNFKKFKIVLFCQNKKLTIKIGFIKVVDTSKKGREKNPKRIKTVQKRKEFGEDYINAKKVILGIRNMLLDKNDDIIYFIRTLKDLVYIKKADFSIDYGFGDAAVTGIFDGILWGLISFTSSFLNKYIDIKNILNIAVKPHYTDKIFEYKSEIIIYVKLKNLIKLLKYINRMKKTFKEGN